MKSTGIPWVTCLPTVRPVPRYSPRVAAMMAATPAVDDPVVVPPVERRGDLVGDYPLRKRVGDCALKAVAHLEVHLVRLGEDEQDGAVVPALDSGVPRLRDPHRVVLYRRVALHRREDRDHDLVRRVALELRELPIERCGRPRADERGVVVEVGLRRRRDHLRGARSRGREREGGKGDCARDHGFAGAGVALKSNLTVGGVSEPGVAVK